MNDAEIIQHINDGANYYISMFGQAEHMEICDKGAYSIVQPKPGEEGISFIYNIRVESLSRVQQHAVVQEIRALGMPFWLDLTVSDEVFTLFFGKEKPHGQTEFAFDDEQYLAMLPAQFINTPAKYDIFEVHSPEVFALWSKMANDMLADGHRDIHPIHHFNLVERRLMRCYILYVDGIPASVAATMNHHGIVSLELVATLPEYRRIGCARDICTKAVQDAIDEECSLLTVRANSEASARVYRSLGFQGYNHAL